MSAGGIDAYFQFIFGVLANSAIIKSQDVQTERRTPAEGYLRGNVLFKDDTRLHFRELVTTDPKIQRVSYTYHYQRADAALIFRYDDANHFPKLSTAPHHKHIGDTEVVAANPPDLEIVLKEIEGLIKA